MTKKDLAEEEDKEAKERRESWWRQVLTLLPEKEEEEEILEAIEPPEVPKHGNASDSVSWSLRVAAAWSWRALVVGLLLVTLGYGIVHLAGVVLPILLGLLMALILDPLNGFLRRIRLPHAAAAGISLLAGLGLLIGIVVLAGSQIAVSMGSLVEKATVGLQRAVDWLSTGPFHIDKTALSKYVNEFVSQLQGFLTTRGSEVAVSITSSALSITSSVLYVVTTLLIALFCLFFFLKDGRQIWIWIVRILPIPARETVHEAGVRGWITLKGYIKAQVLVAAVDSVSITLGAIIVGIPMSLGIPLGLLIFIGCFVPIVGSLVTGIVAVLVCLVDQGPKSAIILLIIIIVVQQVEGNVLQPLFMSSAVSLHPLAVLLAVTAGTYLAGIAGALFAVPLVAFVNTVVLYISGHDRFEYLDYDFSRPGGAPNTVHAQVKASYQEGMKDAKNSKARKRAEKYIEKVTKPRKSNSSEAQPSPACAPQTEENTGAQGEGQETTGD